MNSDRIREIQEATPYPNSQGVCSALHQVWNELAQGHRAELTQLRADLARAEGERDNALTAQRIADKSFNDLIKAMGEIKQERDTLKAECEELTAELDVAVREKVGARERKAYWKDRATAAEAQITQAEEARKLCAVQMMALEEERERLEALLSGYKMGYKDRAENCEAFAARAYRTEDAYQEAVSRAEKAESQLTTSREEGHRQGMERAAEIADQFGTTRGEFIAQRIRAESSTLPRTYEQGADALKNEFADKVYAEARALPTKEG